MVRPSQAISGRAERLKMFDEASVPFMAVTTEPDSRSATHSLVTSRGLKISYAAPVHWEMDEM